MRNDRQENADLRMLAENRAATIEMYLRINEGLLASLQACHERIERMRPVIEAAQALRGIRRDGAEVITGMDWEALRRLLDAVEAMEGGENAE